jgi:thymidine kinase
MKQIDSGYLEIILGPMFSGKTSKLIDIYKQYHFCNISTLVVNHADDNRYDQSQLTTHDGTKIDCEKWNTLNEFMSHHRVQLMDDEPIVILINEGQFFSDLYSSVERLVNLYKAHVYVCGLDGDFKREKFGQLLDLIPLSDNVYKLSSLCVKCKDGTRSIFSHRITNETDQKMIGSSESYIPLCRKCYETVS